MEQWHAGIAGQAVPHACWPGDSCPFSGTLHTAGEREKKRAEYDSKGTEATGKNHIFVQNQLLSTLFQVDRLVLARWSALAF